MIPDFTLDGNLPPGVHLATWEEISERFGTTPHRQRLLAGFREAMAVFREAGCRRVYLDGSYVTCKVEPNDYDALWDPTGVDVARLLELEPVFAEFEHGRASQKAKYSGEFFPARMTERGSGLTFLEFFQTDRHTGETKGIVAIDL